MNAVLDKKSGIPLYLQLYRQIRTDIINGTYSYGSKLPSKRILSQELGVSVITAEHALAQLDEEGYIESKQRSGYFVSYRDSALFSVPVISEDAARIHKKPITTFDDGSISFDLYAKMIRKTLAEYNNLLLQKCPCEGCLPFRKAISGYLARSRGIHAEEEQIIIGSGAEYLYSLIALMLGTDRIYAIEAPSYGKIEKVYRSLGVTCDLLPMDSDGINSLALSRTDASVLHITPYRSYPTGITANASKCNEYIRWSKRDERVIIEDDYCSELSLSSKPKNTLFADSYHENVIYINTFSKTVSNAIRIGYMVLPQKFISVFKEKAGFRSCTVPVLEQYFLTKLIETGAFERHINKMRRNKRKRKLQ